VKAKEVLQAETEASWFAPHTLALIATSLELSWTKQWLIARDQPQCGAEQHSPLHER
jgi:hypothetical protein